MDIKLEKCEESQPSTSKSFPVRGNKVTMSTTGLTKIPPGPGKNAFKCDICGKAYSSLSLLKRHTYHFHTWKRQEWKCQRCYKSFECEKSLSIHFHANHKVNTKFICRICGKEFNNKLRVKKHIHRLHSWKCDYCERILQTKDDMVHHMNAKHLDKYLKPITCRSADCKTCFKTFLGTSNHQADNEDMEILYECDKCHKDFVSVHELQTHGRVHEIDNVAKDEQVKCNVCKQGFNSRSSLNRHTLDCHTWVCDLCDKIFELKDLLKQHLIDQHNETTVSITAKLYCNICGNEQDSTVDLDRHIAESHNFECEYCSKSFDFEFLKTEHVNREHKAKDSDSEDSEEEVVQVEHKCYVCSDVFKSSLELERHKEAHKPHNFECIHCKTKFTSRIKLKRHNLVLHPWKCRNCSDVFNNKYVLMQHIIDKHGGQLDTLIQIKLQANCELCRIEFRSPQSLKRHIKEVHTYECRHCSEAFDFNIELKLHLADEHKDKPQVLPVRPKCDMCDMQFSNKFTLTKHVNEEHGWKCENCEKIFESWKYLIKHIKDEHLDKTAEEQDDDVIEIDDYKCDKCLQVFESFHALETHEKVHNMKIDLDSLEEISNSLEDISEVKENCLQEALGEDVIGTEMVTPKNSQELFVKEDEEIIIPDHLACGESFEIAKYECDKCPVSFESFHELERHGKVHVLSKAADNTIDQTQESFEIAKYECDKCQLAFESFHELERHGKVHILEETVDEHNCSYCKKVFVSRIALSRHTLDFHTWGCKYCKESFKSKQLRNEHMRSAHNEQFDHKCDKCGMTFTRKDSLYRHTMTVHKCILKCDYWKELYQRKLSKANADNKRKDSEQIQVGDSEETVVSDEMRGEGDDYVSDSEAIVIHPDEEEPDLEEHFLSDSEGDFISSDTMGVNDENTQDKPEVYFEDNHDSEELCFQEYFEVSGYECDKCPKVFGSFHELENHGKVHIVNDNYPQETEAETLFTCTYCHRSFKQEEFLIDHMTDQHGYTTCETCSTMFDTKALLETHIRENHLWRCEICEKVFGWNYLLIIHRRDRHNIKDILPKLHCDKCDQFYHTKSKLEKHLKTHKEIIEDGTKISCDKCDQFFYTNCELEKHLKTHNEIFIYGSKTKNGFIECRICKKRFPTNIDLSNHFKRAHVKIKYQCSKCIAFFFDLKKIREHIVQIHNIRNNVIQIEDPHSKDSINSEIFVCNRCPEEFESFEELQKHGQVHIECEENEGDSKEKFGTFLKCRHCCLKFQQVAVLNKHISSQHSIVACEICLVKFTNQSKLDYHIQIIHSWSCNKCSKIFDYKHMLTQHFKDVHIPRFECNQCDKVFFERNLLENHLKIHSSSEDKEIKIKYKCSKCDSVFFDLNQIKQHISEVHKKDQKPDSHENKDPAKKASFKCKQCPKVFKLSSDLEKHGKVHIVKDLEDLVEQNSEVEEQTKAEKEDVQIKKRLKFFECHVCKKLLVSKYNLSNHYKVAHPEIKIKYKCSECDAFFFDIAEIKEHISKVHITQVTEPDSLRPEELLKCNMCPEVFESFHKLEEHAKVHIKIETNGNSFIESNKNKSSLRSPDAIKPNDGHTFSKRRKVDVEVAELEVVKLEPDESLNGLIE